MLRIPTLSAPWDTSQGITGAKNIPMFNKQRGERSEGLSRRRGHTATVASGHPRARGLDALSAFGRIVTTSPFSRPSLLRVRVFTPREHRAPPCPALMYTNLT